MALLWLSKTNSLLQAELLETSWTQKLRLWNLLPPKSLIHWALNHFLGVEVVNTGSLAVDQIVCTENTTNFTSNGLHGIKMPPSFSLSALTLISCCSVFNSYVSSTSSFSSFSSTSSLSLKKCLKPEARAHSKAAIMVVIIRMMRWVFHTQKKAQVFTFPFWILDVKHRKNCKCCPGHSLIVNH